MINNSNINNDINIILFIKKKNIDIEYVLFYEDEPIQTKTIEQYNINEYEKYISDGSVVIDMNPMKDSYKNVLYCINNRIPIIMNKKYIASINNNIVFSEIEDIFDILQDDNICSYIQTVLQYNQEEKEKILLEYQTDTTKNIDYTITKIDNTILNVYMCLQDLDHNYRLHDYIHCIKHNLQFKYLNMLYLFKKNEYNIEYIPNNILQNDKIRIIVVNDYKISTLFEFINKYDKNINCILNTDIYINNMDNYIECLNDIVKNPNNIYCLSRIETDTIKFWEHPKLKNLYYSLTQDAWIFNGAIKMNNVNCKLVLGNVWNDIIFNNYLIVNGYNLINKGKSIPVLHLDSYILKKRSYIDPIRVMNTNIQISNEKYHFLPDKDAIEKCSIDKLVAELKISDDDKYEIKKYIINKYIKIN
jgi:hypothetical protein